MGECHGCQLLAAGRSFSPGGEKLHRQCLYPRNARGDGRRGPLQASLSRLAQGPLQTGLGCAPLAHAIWRYRLERDPALHLQRRKRARRDDPACCPSACRWWAPVIFTFGNDEQKKTYLPRILSGEDWWCQGYSEPGAGSDLASLRTRAVREGDHYIVNGQKTWTTLAQYRRLDLLPRPHRSDRQTAGRHLVPAHRHEDAWHHREADHRARWRPRSERSFLRQCEGAGRKPHRRREQGLDLCQIPARQRTFGHCRRCPLQEGHRAAEGNRHSRNHRRRAAYRDRRIFAQDRRAGDRADRARIHRTAHAGRRIKGPDGGSRKLDPQDQGHRDPAAHHRIDARSGRLLRLSRRPQSRRQRVSVGPDYARGQAGHYFNMRKASIYGGSNEIQRNIIAKAVLGL